MITYMHMKEIWDNLTGIYATMDHRAVVQTEVENRRTIHYESAD